MNFWQVHGEWFVVAMIFFPRLTFLFSSVASGGVLWWLGWLFSPRLLAAILVTDFWATNPVLVGVTWLWAVLGEYKEKITIQSKAGKV